MAVTQQQQQQKRIVRPPGEAKPPNAEHATSIAIEFLKALGNKHGIKPRKVSLQGQAYAVELDVGKDKTAVVQIEAQTREIKEYEIKMKEKEESGLNLPFSPKLLVMIFGVSAVVYFVFEFLNVSGLLFGR
jgi:phage anti-repressor protein